MKKNIKKQLVIMVLAIAFIIIALSGCTSHQIDKALLVGTWHDSNGNYMTFTSDGTYNSDLWVFGGSGSWDINNDKLVITHTGFGGTTSTTYGVSLSNNNNQLSIESSSYKYIFTKQ